jgi:microcystin-dependent protein
MDQPYIGVIFAHAATFAPRDWAFCQGQVQSIANNDTLYALIGTTFGGDGQVTFNLPDLRGRIPVGQGQGPGLSNYVIGQMSGSENVTVLSTQMPTHTHLVNVVNSQGNAAVPTSSSYIAGTYSGSGSSAVPLNFYGTTSSGATLAPTTISAAGNSLPINIVQPILATQYIIALYGIFPSRN